MKARWFYILLFAFMSILSHAKARPDTLLLHRVYAYTGIIDTTLQADSVVHVYTKYSLHVKKRNVALLAVPSMYAIAHGKHRFYIGETLERLCLASGGHYSSQKIVDFNTIPHHRHSMTTVLKYLTPRIYHETMINDNLLSPFNYHNRKYYKYKVVLQMNGTAKIIFSPKSKNTQLVRGEAKVETKSGRVLNMVMKGEFDMVNFSLNIRMGKAAPVFLIPSEVQLDCTFSFLGSKTLGRFRAVYGVDASAAGLQGLTGREQLALVRPTALTPDEQAVYDKAFPEVPDDSTRTAGVKKNNWVKTVLWDIVGDNLLNRIKSNYGKNNQGYLRINPILNPLYMGYDHRRGYTYKFDVRTSYNLSSNQEISLRFKSGYSFKQQQIFFRIPVLFYYNKSKNGYMEMEIEHGNWVRNKPMEKKMREVLPDSVIDSNSKVAYFKDTGLRFIGNYDINSHWGFQVGMAFHKRVAIVKEPYLKAGMPTQYTSAAPLVEIQWRPTGWKGPYLTFDYERGIKSLFGGDIDYERWETDAQWIKKLTRLQSLQLRFGTGLYSRRDSKNYFLDYSNFRENNLPGGWNDDWSGEFELLDSYLYNESKWYVRANITYESPLLLLSRIPGIGRFMEMERIYMGALEVNRVHPYIEVGYGFTTRLFSMGVFVSNQNGRFKEYGCKFGFELFRHW